MNRCVFTFRCASYMDGLDCDMAKITNGKCIYLDSVNFAKPGICKNPETIRNALFDEGEQFI